MLSVLFMTRSLLEKASSAAGLSMKKDQIETRFRAVFPGEVRSFAQSCLIRAGATEEHAASLAELLVAADTRGHFSHGLNRLDMYVKEIESGICDGQAAPEVVQETPATAFVDGKNGIGPVVGTFCMDLAIKKAKTVGIAWVNCTGSNHYGIAGWYAIRAAENGLIGMSFTNTSPLQVPTRAKKPVLGTNPIAFAAPGRKGDHFVLDMATSTAALGKVEVCHRREIPIPNAWGVDSEGIETNNPSEVLNGGGLMPLGGSEQTAGYKGYGLAAMVEVLCGVLSGGPFAHHIRRWKSSKEIANLGQSFMAMNPDCFAPGFQDRLQTMMDELRNLEPSDPSKPVLVAGDPERLNCGKVDNKGVIPYPQQLISVMDEMADRLGVDRIVSSEWDPN